ncbi:Rho guanine nucleotide exchange factor 16, variant 2 [Clonorchis sinensis]|uniref:Rho guanine nucleotide exchange factor 16, variant 2 n=1 Tax=Clonorchis sinensis TaxID=79923 RepID=A0A8T1MUL7_CLOSI|nr:Rho guanine nucleotide exchange factor 16, variant 2 [Clonorchis sinensis]
MKREEEASKATGNYQELKKSNERPSAGSETAMTLSNPTEPAPVEAGSGLEAEEEVVTQSMPPTEVVNTVVTVTTNPDGSLKRTTRKTTRTMVTTTRVRRIATKSSAVGDGSAEEPTIPLPTECTETTTQPQVITLIGAPQDEGDDRVSQATFTFMRPTTRTEVLVTEEEHDIDQLDAEVAKYLGSLSDSSSPEKSPGEQKSHTKTTVRKTVTASAATATFVSKGPSKTGILPRIFDPNKIFKHLPGQSPTKVHSSDAQFEPVIMETKENSSNGSTTTTNETTTTTTTTTTATTTRKMRVGNTFAHKSLLITRAGLESLKKPFNLFIKEMRRDSKSEGERESRTDNTNLDMEDTEQLALIAMKESERLFSEAGFLLPSITAAGCNQQVIVQPSQGSPFKHNLNQTAAKHFQSRFANLPLYQGYGLIGQQLAMCKQPVSCSAPTVVTTTIQTSDSAGAQNELDKNTAAGALMNLLDESTERFLREALNQWCTMGYPQFDKPSLSALGMSPREIMPVEEEQKALGWSEDLPPDEVTAKDETLVSRTFQAKDADLEVKEDKQNLSTDLKADSATGARLSRLGVPSQGAFRVAWSEMPEVLNSNALMKLTRHEVQLQEAMFEVITSEASYYQSLNVLVKHYYNSPEFSYGSTAKGDLPTSPSQAVSLGISMAQIAGQVSLENGTDTPQESNPGTVIPTPTPISGGSRRPLLKPLEKHHLFSNVLLVCLASEKFLKDLETRWVSQMPILNEVCDLIVKHAGGANFEPYITYLRNQAYQMETLRKLCQRDSFRSTLETLHSHPISGKNSLGSFLALPMQRLTRLKLLVEVIRRLQDSVIQEASDPVQRKSPYRVPTDRERENVQLALRELSRLLASSETEKELMDQKARLLTLSSALEFPDNVKSIAISDKRLIKEGEVREGAPDSRISMLQKLSLKKPSSFYLILFNDLLLVTKKKKNERYLVLDYCDRAELQAEVISLTALSRTLSGNISAQKSPLIDEASQKSLGMPTSGKSGSPSTSPGRRARRGRPVTTMDFGLLSPAVPETQTRQSHEEPVTSECRVQSRGIARSGSSLSSYQIRPHAARSTNYGGHSPTLPSEQSRAVSIHLTLTASHNGTFSDLYLLPKDNDELESWCKAFSIDKKFVPLSKTKSPMKTEVDEKAQDSPASSLP